MKRGPSSLTLSLDGLSTRHDMEFGRPPAALADLYAISMDLIDTLQTCETSELASVEARCEPVMR